MKYILIFMLVGCGSQPDLITSHGVEFHSDHLVWNSSQISDQEDWFIENLDQLHSGYSHELVGPKLLGVTVFVYEGPIPCGASSPTGLCNGLQDGRILHVRNMGCVYNSAYTHELMHWIQQALGHGEDFNHIEPGVWLIADGAPRSCW